MILLQGTYNAGVVVLSIFIAILSSYSALDMAGRVWQARGRSRWGWTVAGAVMMGCGVWSMHFVAMLAFHLNAPVSYHAGATVLSLLAAIFASFIAFYLIQRESVHFGRLAFGSLVMGSGIAAMHYIGMSAIQITGGSTSYDRFYWCLSVAVAIMVSYAALLLFTRFRDSLGGGNVRLWKWCAAVLMGLAVCGMHYTGMQSVSFWCSAATAQEGAVSSNYNLLWAVTLAMGVLLLVSWAATYVDRTILERMAYQDQLTGLPNRYELVRQFDSFLRRTERGAVLFIDIDQFKTINDTLGHDVGDLLVLDASRRLAAIANGEIMVFRIGGDEFLLLAEGGDQNDAEQLAKRLLSSINQSFHIDGNELFVSCSIGIALYPEHGSDRAELLRTSDTALYEAKGGGRNRYQLFNLEIQEKQLRRMQLENDLRSALEYGKQFIVYYQPKWDTTINRPIGFEALVRWNHPKLGFVPPSEFIAIAEETGLIVDLSRFVLRQACRDCREWEKAGYGPFTVSVNTSVRLFDSQNLFDMVEESLLDFGLAPERLELEITETIVIHDMDEVIRQLNRLRELGVKVSMDDFGSGYSSLGSLDLIPLDTVKIDRMFINQSHIPSKRAIINTIVTLAQELGLDSVAEGVEDKEQVRLLNEAGCTIIQGYYFGQPMSLEQVLSYLHNLRLPPLDKEIAAGLEL
ncbi:putative bifunctional diguanylate cyclase/phosphodiesterase [Paenibacillus xylaniclasticus]|uniref:putative bifunctional diguanylate cyclase/phosphodiesterase n=1 Tax=Paenibacillus xylaniclasticus TaxID=588083 RepID=UPI000FDCC653|nr:MULTISPECIES: bifunctional diguanylate cyclase/phosphodiesterase [Paenibacillus]GFN31529.1 putative signaling protein [Paenibacillus curdlanolyticus]